MFRKCCVVYNVPIYETAFCFAQELEKRFSQTGAYKNLKKMLASKNASLKELRKRLDKYEPNSQQEDYED